ncbi:MAG: glycosyltransferase family 4 protein [Candidatus Pacebacteria bacterium]|nr:glycosyltransferase family 4 protein [Candidatus Paceibacterota bacterium]
MNKNKVFMIGWEYPPHNSGGLGVACQGLTTSLAELSDHIYFSLPYKFSGSIKHMTLLDCSHPDWCTKGFSNISPPFFAYDHSIQIPAVRRLDPANLNVRQLSSLAQSDLERQVNQYQDQVIKNSQKKDFGVIHAHDWMSFPAGMSVKQKTGKPLITHVHSTEFDRSPVGGSAYIMNSEFEGMQFADRVIAVSAYTKKILIDKYKIDEKKIDVVHNGIDPISDADPGKHHFAKSRPMVVFMGRLTGQKGPEYFIQLANSVLKKIPEAIFVVAGNGDLYHELLFTTANKGLSSKMLFSGFVRGDQKSKLLDRADVFVMPSISEPFGLVAVEAAQRSTPVIISKTSGVAEVLPSSIQVDFWDIDLMTNKIVELLNDQNLSEDVISGQHNELKNVTWKSAAQKVMDVYKNVTS